MNKQDKENLKGLTEHAGFKVLEAIVEDKRQSMLSQLETLPLWDAEVIQKLSQTQNYVKGMKDLLTTAKAKTQEVVKAPDMS